MRDFVKQELIFMTLAGSRMYGTSTPESDVDKRGVCVPPQDVELGFARSFKQLEFEGEDTVVYSLRRFMELASGSNPNVIELLFVPEDCIETIHPTWEKLRARRKEFLSAKCYKTFTGYATGQLKRMRTHRSWLRDTPTHKPTRAEFGLAAAGTGVREIAKGVDLCAIDPAVGRLIEKERKFKSALTRWNQYNEWKEKRNPKRAKLELNYGYDTKHAMHLVRLLRMGHEILTKGDLTVRRPDAEELLALRKGALSYDELMVQVEELQSSIDEVYNNRTYVVQDEPDREALSDFCVELYQFHWTRAR